MGSRRSLACRQGPLPSSVPLSVSCFTAPRILCLSLRNSPPEKGICGENQGTMHRLPLAFGTANLSILDAIGKCLLRNFKQGAPRPPPRHADATTTSFTIQLYIPHPHQLTANTIPPYSSYPPSQASSLVILEPMDSYTIEVAHQEPHFPSRVFRAYPQHPKLIMLIICGCYP